MTNVEIEDVLSSIRRLVSENARSDDAKDETNREASDSALDALAAATAKPAEKLEKTPEITDGDDEGAPMAEDVQPVSNMLVLTADHRVPEAANLHDEVQEDLASELDEIHHWADDGAETRVEEIAEQEQLEAVIHDAIDEAVQDIVADIETDYEPDVDQDDLEETLDVSEPSNDVPEDAVEALTFTHRGPDFGLEDGIEDDTAALASRIAELEAAVGERDDQWEPDGDGDGGDNAGGPVEAMAWEDTDVPESGHDHVWEADPLVVEESQMVEPEEPEPEPESEPAEPVQEAAPEPESEPDSEPESAADPQLARDLDPTPELFADSDAVIDEETLREMVAEIVRRELQGSLGERITRNVRKLVRREIHRALAARELD
ncbi:hypothetical protein [Aliisedimentitalea sp. MJ-SS2]|uniref:hypothetical protein n=1 Tax=Aliisedimentitalea sp. MJ-SS2 TaxID=3049795 RepID=UPI00292D7A04|nr:hypothetical protein [Alisedimentitalea sp. MJ-SS2]